MLKVELQSRLGELDIKLKFEVPSRGITAVFGRSGAGKTSLVNYIAGLLSPQRGRITLNEHILFDHREGINLPPEKRRIGYVFQEARLFPHYDVKKNLRYGMKDKTDSDQFDAIVTLLDIAPLLPRYPATLSGGEQQRIAIGRALLSQPDLLLLDEPLASLDLPRKKELLPYLARLAKEVEIPVLYVSHSLEEIAQLADQMLLIEKGQIVENGSLEKVWTTAAMGPWLEGDARSALINAKVAEPHPDYPLTSLDIGSGLKLWLRQLPQQAGQSLRLRIRANDVSLSKQPLQSSIRNILPARISALEADNSGQIEVSLQLGEHLIWAHITRWAQDELNLDVGDDVYVQLKGISLMQDNWPDI